MDAILELDRVSRRFGDRDALAAQRQAAARTAAAIRWLSPPLVLEELLQSVAGSDAAAQALFVQRAQDYTERLRAFFWPRAIAQAVRPSAPCPGCMGRQAFTEHQRIPAFATTAAAPTRQELTQAGYLLLLALAGAVGVIGRPGLKHC